MIRVVALQLFLLALPFVLYAAYVYLRRQAEPEGGVFADAPLYWLAATGLVLAIVSFVAIAVFSSGEPGGVYVPAEVRDGRIIPGHIVPPGSDAAGEPPSR